MKKTTVFFYPVQAEELQVLREDKFHTVLRTRHGRRIYLALELNEGRDAYIVRECEYVDRTRFMVPRKLKTYEITKAQLSRVLMRELDCCVSDCFIKESGCDSVSKEQLLAQSRDEEHPYTLLLLRTQNALYTCFKNRHRRAIRLLVIMDSDKKGQASIRDCRYCDARAERSSRVCTPYGLVTISFEYSLNKLLEIVNQELEGGFSGILIAEEYCLPTIDTPFCGRI